MRVEHVVGEPDDFVFWPAGEQTPDGLIRGQDAMPKPFAGCVRDCSSELGAIAVPKRELTLSIRHLRWTDHQVSGHANTTMMRAAEGKRILRLDEGGFHFALIRLMKSTIW